MGDTLGHNGTPARPGLILAIDPGTYCGWAVLDWAGNRVSSGVWDLAPRRHEGGGMRFLRLRRYLSQVRATFQLDAIGYEEVVRHRGVSAAHVYGGIVAILQEFAERNRIGYRGYPVGTVKRYATGKGNAPKSAMIAAAVERFGMPDLASDDEADALWIGALLIDDLGE
jgi:Holliday junction resolvasome RuvABC endonuclease subunit